MATIILQNHASFRLHKLSTSHDTSSTSEFSQNLTSPLLDRAKSFIRPDQASSYGDAIKMAKKYTRDNRSLIWPKLLLMTGATKFYNLLKTMLIRENLAKL
ncbi:hypothetical protein CRD_02672 [Raphidiopsis brookii D9]|nr:hypothetical protein CRD_02672 [Raphidiopsis brookii D9]